MTPDHNMSIDQLIEELKNAKRYIAKLESEAGGIGHNKNEKKLEEVYNILNMSPAAVILWKNKPGWPVDFASENVQEIFGYSAQEFTSGKVQYSDLIHPDDFFRVAKEATDFTAEYDRTERVRFSHEPYRIITRTGKIKWLEDRTHFRKNEHGNITHHQGIVLDITEIKRAEKERLLYLDFLKKMELIEKAILGASDIDLMLDNLLLTVLSIYQCDRAWLLYPCDPEAPSWKILMEHTRPEYPGAGALGKEFPMTEDIAGAFKIILDAASPRTGLLAGGEHDWDHDDNFRVRSTLTMAIHPKVGKPWIFGLHQCSHSREWTTAEQNLFNEIGHRLSDSLGTHLTLRELEKQAGMYRAITENTSTGTVILNRDNVFTYASPSIQTIVGYNPDEILTRTPEAFIHPDDLSTINETLSRVVSEQGKTLPLSEFRLKHKKGHYVTLDGLVTSMFEVPGVNGIVCNFRDITEHKRDEEERRQLEIQIQHAQKLESLGVLAGGIAHDFNNILMAILGNADLALDEIPEPLNAKDNINSIIKSSKRAAELCRQMLAYSGKGKFIIQTLNMVDVIKEMAPMLNVSISKKITLNYNLTDNIPPIEADSSQLSQVVMNLVTNASEAIGNKNGTVSISTGVMECDRSYLTETYLDDNLLEGFYCYIEVADTGCGMDCETVDRIFDPFFSTKFTGRGLGMAAVLGIVRGHNGAIKVKSEPGEGATLKVLFPSSIKANPPAATPDDEDQRKDHWSGNGMILLVDDEEDILSVSKQLLEKLGFQVLLANNGQKCIDVFKDYKDLISCVILDLTMPIMDGEATFKELRQIDKNVCVIISSGYNEQDVTQRFSGEKLGGFIQKPYTFDNISAVVKKALPGRSGD